MYEQIHELAATFAEQVAFVNKEVLTSDEAARYLGVSKSTLYKWTMNRTIPHFKPAGKICYFNRSELEAWMQSRRISTEQELNEKAQMMTHRKRD